MSGEKTSDIHESKSDSTINPVSKNKEKLPSLKEMKKETVSQTYQYVNQLIKGKQFQDFDNINEVVFANEPLPLFEESLRLILIDAFQLENEVIKVLLSQNNHQIKRILRCNWFFQSSLSPDYYCTKIFPYISVSLRYKIINRLSRNLKREKDAEELFDFICSNYCYQQAEILLPKCSAQFILDVFMKRKPLFASERSGTILLHITQRYPDVGLHILDAKFGVNDYCHGLYIFKDILLYLADSHPQIFIEFFEKYYSKITFVNFGRKLSQKLGLKLKDLVLQSSELSKLKIFKQESLFKMLSFEDQAKYLASRVIFDSETLSFSSWSRASHNFIPLLKLLRPDLVLPMIESAFHQVYSLNYSDCSKAWTFEILELIPLSERLPYVESLEKLIAMYNSDQEGKIFDLDESPIWEANNNPERLIYLKEFSVAFKDFKRILSKAPTLNERERILRYAVQNCVINRDAKGLEQLIDYVGTRLRNDNHKLIFKILEEVSEFFPASAFTFDTVQKLEEICYLGAIRGDHYHYVLLMEKCILRRLEEGLDVKIQVGNVVDLALVHGTSTGSILNVRSKHSRKLFHEYYREIFRWIEENPADKNAKHYLRECLLNTLVKFNEIHKKDPILLRDLPELSAEAEELLKERHAEVGFNFNWIDLWERFPSEVMGVFCRSKFFIYTLRRNPEMVIGNMEPVWKYLFRNYSEYYYLGKEFFSVLKKVFSFLGLTDQLKGILLEKFKTEDSTTVKVNALKMYARVCDPEEFAKAVHDYVPKEGKFDLKEESKFLKVQLAIPLIIKDVKPDWKNLPLILKFLSKDFLKNVSPSFMSYCYHTRSDIVIPTLIELLNKIPDVGRIAYEKSVVRLIAEVASRQQKLEFCAKRWEHSRHYSVRTILLRFISKSFLEDPTTECFEILSKCILESDEVIIISKPDINQVPKEFVNDYLALLWKFSEGQTKTFKQNFRNSVLMFFKSQNINWLSEKLSQYIIKSNLFKRSGVNVDEFAIYYLVSEPGKMKLRIKVILDVLKDSVVDETMLSTFLKTLKNIWLEGSCSFANVFETLLKNWPDSIPISFDEQLTLNYCLLYEKSRKKSNEEESGDMVSGEFGKLLKAFYLSFDNSNDFVLIFFETLKHFFGDLKAFNKTLTEVLVAKELLAHPSVRSLVIIAILILPQTVVKFYQNECADIKDSSRKDFIDVIGLLRDYQDKVVQIYFTRKFGFKNFEYNTIKT